MNVKEGVINLESNHENSLNNDYATERMGGGQEVYTFEGKKYQRTHTGEHFQTSKFPELGIGKNEVVEFLNEVKCNHGEKIRLFNNFYFGKNIWKYRYQITKKSEEDIPTNAIETVIYKRETVYFDMFAFSPILSS